MSRNRSQVSLFSKRYVPSGVITGAAAREVYEVADKIAVMRTISTP